MDKSPVRHYIRAWRKHKGFTQKQLSQMIDFSNSALSQLETGRTHYRQEMLEQVAKALDCKPSDLLVPPYTVDGVIFPVPLTSEQRGKLLAINLTIAKEMWGADETP
jgi:transcriptional regulator with XRE-family HTH domain